MDIFDKIRPTARGKHKKKTRKVRKVRKIRQPVLILRYPFFGERRTDPFAIFGALLTYL